MVLYPGAYRDVDDFDASLEDDDMIERENAYNNLRKRIRHIPNLDYEKDSCNWNSGL